MLIIPPGKEVSIRTHHSLIIEITTVVSRIDVLAPDCPLTPPLPHLSDHPYQMRALDHSIKPLCASHLWKSTILKMIRHLYNRLLPCVAEAGSLQPASTCFASDCFCVSDPKTGGFSALPAARFTLLLAPFKGIGDASSYPARALYYLRRQQTIERLAD